MSSKKPASKSNQTTKKTAVEGADLLKELKGNKDQIHSKATNFESYVFKVLNQVYPDISLKMNMKIMRHFISEIFERFVEIGVPIDNNERRKLNSEDLTSAIKSVLTSKI